MYTDAEKDQVIHFSFSGLQFLLNIIKATQFSSNSMILKPPGLQKSLPMQLTSKMKSH